MKIAGVLFALFALLFAGAAALLAIGHPWLAFNPLIIITAAVVGLLLALLAAAMLPKGARIAWTLMPVVFSVVSVAMLALWTVLPQPSSTPPAAAKIDGPAPATASGEDSVPVVDTPPPSESNGVPSGNALTSAEPPEEEGRRIADSRQPVFTAPPAQASEEENKAASTVEQGIAKLSAGVGSMPKSEAWKTIRELRTALEPLADSWRAEALHESLDNVTMEFLAQEAASSYARALESYNRADYAQAREAADEVIDTYRDIGIPPLNRALPAEPEMLTGARAISAESQRIQALLDNPAQRFELRSIVTGSQGASVQILDQLDGQGHRVEQGGYVAGYRVMSIDTGARSVTLGGDGESFTLFKR